MEVFEAVEINSLPQKRYFFTGDQAFINTMQFSSHWSGKTFIPLLFSSFLHFSYFLIV
jgi:hypothetical protein